MSDIHTYETSVQWTTQRRAALSSKGLPTIEVATPPEFPNGHEGIWSPEHLFTAAAEACLMTTFLSIAEKSQFTFKAYSSKAVGILEKTDSGFLMTRIVIMPTLLVEDEGLKAKGLKLLEKAERHCLIANSMKSEISLQPTVLVG